MVMKVSYHVDAPVETVYDYFMDPASGAGMGAEVVESKVTKEGVGTYMSWRMKAAGIPVYQGFQVVTEAVPNKRIVERSSRALVGDWEYSFAPEGSGTKVTMQHSSRSFWAMPPLRNAVDYATTRLSRRYVAQVRQELAARKPAAPAPAPRKATPSKPRKATASR